MNLTAGPVINLLHEATYSTLATQSERLPGYPYATLVPNVLDQCQRPLLLVSALAEHTRNLLADPRLSLSLLEPGAVQIQTAARISLLGDAERFEPGKLLQARYLRYIPDAAQYLELDFMFFRIIPRRIRFIAGVGRMGWLGPEEWRSLPSLPLEQESALLEAAQSEASAAIAILGIDLYGIDYVVAGFRKRHVFAAGEGRSAIDEGFLRTAVAQLS